MIDIIGKIQFDKKKVILAVIVLVFILYIDFSFILKAQFKMLKVINPKIAQLKKDIKKLNSDLASLKDIGKTKEETQEAAIKIVDTIIKVEKVPKILEDIAKIANKWEVKIMQIRPLKPSLVKPEPSTPIAKFFPLLITLDITGTYHNIGKFINELENAPVFIAVEELLIKPDQINYLNQKITLTLKTYVKK